MTKLRHMYPGANSCRGFYSFYQYMLWPEGERKIILKGGPGVGK
ncbi:MAG TPA: ATPase, partial [Syntrophomonas wolfei]|nr:ATPase [Syntrophomonas wolfei]